MLHFGVLGPFVARRGDEPIAFPTAMLARLAAILLCSPHAALPADTLADALWNGAPPPSGRRTLLVYVSRLRRLLGDDLVVREVGGYRINLDGAGLDSADFLARLARADCSPRDLDEALALWRGDAFAGFEDCDFVVRHAADLTGERVRALRLRADSRVRAGAYDEGVEDLLQIVALRPYDESAHAALMRALAGGGRQAEALDVFRRLRERLVDEFGAEPGEEPARLHGEMLRGEAPRGSGPSFLPHDIGDFVGRRDTLEELDALLPAGGARPMVVLGAVDGMGGVGKTATAVRWAHRCSDRFPDGQLFVDLRGYAAERPVTSAQALASLLRCLDVPAERIPLDVDAAAALFRARVAHRRMLLLIDNARGADDVRPLLPGTPTVTTIVTSRDRLSGLVSRNGARRITVGLLGEDESRDLLTAIAGPERIASQPSATARLIALCGGLPLAVRIAAAYLVDHPQTTVDAYVGRLADTDLSGWAVEGDAAYGVAAVLRQSYEALDGRVRRMFRLLGLLPGPHFGVRAAAALAGVTPTEAGPVLDLIHSGHLLDRIAPDRFALHDIVRRLAREIAYADPREVAAARDRMRHFHLAAVRQAAFLLRPGPNATEIENVLDLTSGEQAAQWLDAHLPVVLALAREAGPDDQLPVELLRDASVYLAPRGHWQETAELAGLAEAAAVRVGAHGDQAMALTAGGIAEHRAGNPERALRMVGDSWEIRRTRLGPSAEAASLDMLGVMHPELGNPLAAVACLLRAYQIHRDHGRTASAGIALHNMAHAYEHLDRPRQAQRWYRRSLAYRLAAGDRHGEARTRVEIARLAATASDLDRAADELHRARTMAAQTGNLEVEIQSVVFLAELSRRRNRPAEAYDLLREALLRAERLDQAFELTVVHEQLAVVCAQSGRLARAAEHWQAAQRTRDAGHDLRIYPMRGFLPTYR